MHVGDPDVWPPSMNQQQLREEPELTKGVVGRHRRLWPLKAEKTTANVGFLDHSYVVGAITNSERHGLSTFFDLW
jgi:hypothetical protein